VERPGANPGRSASAMKRYCEHRAAEYDATTYVLAQELPDDAADLAALDSLVKSLACERVVESDVASVG
jgi:hypothetical protein